MSNILEKIKSLNLPEGAEVSLSYSDGTDVFVHNETEVETALQNTDVVQMFSSLVTTPGLKTTTRYGQDPLETLRDEGLLEDYKRGSGSFEDYVSEAITDNFYDVDLIDYSTEKYDHKRGACTLAVEAYTTVENLLKIRPNLFGWSAKIENGPSVVVLEG